MLIRNSDGNIRYYEYQNDKLEFLSEYKSSDPQRGLAFLPKRGVDVHETEVMRAFKTVNDTYIEPISFVVPRRAEGFQDDIYPPTVGLKPAVSSAEWYSGKSGLPPKIDLAAIYAGEEPISIPSEQKPQTKIAEPRAPSPQKIPEPTPDSATSAEPPASVLKGPPPSMKEQTAKVKELASKYGDDEEEEDSGEDDSSFEEIPKPVDRSAVKSASAAAQPTPASQTSEKTIVPDKAPPSQTRQEHVKEDLPPSRGEGAQAPEVQASLAEIKNLLVEQSKTMNAQSATISKLTAEVDRLRAKIGE